MLEKQKAVQAKVKVCLVGDEGVGKTSLIRRFVSSIYDDSYIRTVGTGVSKRDVDMSDEGYIVTMLIWDIMGRRDFIQLFKDAYFKHAKGVMAVFDTTRRKTLDSLTEWVGNVKSTVGDVPTIVLANKSDLEDEYEASDQDIESAVSDKSFMWLYTSAKTGHNVELAFRELASEMLKKFSPEPM